MKTIKIKTPAKLNLTLEIVNKRPDGFHNIKSIMQLIDLYDYLTITTELSDSTEIILSGNSNEIPYNEKNLVHKAGMLFLDKLQKKNGESNYKITVYIEKNIPISAGLAGGSTNAAGMIYGLNKLFNDIYTSEELHSLCAQLGSDLNVCLEGGCLLATSRGEVIEKLPFAENTVSLIKPEKLGISAKEAYTKYSALKNKISYNYTEKMIKALNNKTDIKPYLYNDLETAVFNDYKELQYIKGLYPSSIMSGSGSTYFLLNDSIAENEGYWIKNNLKFISDGVKQV